MGRAVSPTLRFSATRRGVLSASALALTGVLGACTSQAEGGDPQDGLVDSEPGLQRVAVPQRRLAPVASGNDLDGKPLSTKDFPGLVVVINVWGSWCAPCRKEAPDLVRAADRLAGLAQFIGINTRDLDPAQARAFVRSFNVTYPSIFDPAGQELLKFDELPPAAIPSTLIIDRESRIAARVIGVIAEHSLVQLVTEIAEGR